MQCVLPGIVFTLLLVETHAFIPSAGTGFGRPVAVGPEHVQWSITTLGAAGFYLSGGGGQTSAPQLLI
jgi:hypothetical protein